MGIFFKLSRLIKMGGLDLPLFKLEDKLFKTDHAAQLIYKIFEAANSTEYARLIQLKYEYVTGKPFNIENPVTFNEKIQWLKAYDSTTIKTRLADKYLVRNWIAEKIGEEYLVPLLGVWDKFEDIDFECLPNSFALKCNHGSGWNLIVLNKADIDIQEAKEKFDNWMSTNFAFLGGEIHYRDIPPKIIAEQYLDMSGGIKDYKFYCFRGTPVIVTVDLFSGMPGHIRSVYDMDWNKVDLRITWPDGGRLLEKKPYNFELMKSFASLLSEEFAFVRVDFFEVRGCLYMGEMTFTPMNGRGKFDPPIWDRKLGDMLMLPKKKFYQ